MAHTLPDAGHHAMTRPPRDSREPRALADLLKPAAPAAGSALGRLVAAAGAREALLDYLRAGLGPELRPALTGCNLRADGTLVLTAISGAWTARLRFEGPALLARCQARHPEARVVRVRTGSTPGQAPAGTGSA
jgi:hypothetical protein